MLPHVWLSSSSHCATLFHSCWLLQTAHESHCGPDVSVTVGGAAGPSVRRKKNSLTSPRASRESAQSPQTTAASSCQQLAMIRAGDTSVSSRVCFYSASILLLFPDRARAAQHLRLGAAKLSSCTDHGVEQFLHLLHVSQARAGVHLMFCVDANRFVISSYLLVEFHVTANLFRSVTNTPQLTAISAPP